MSRKSLNDLLEEEEFRYEGVLTIQGTRYIIKDWLRDVGLPDYIISTTGVNATKEIRELLIMLVDEP